jgi:flagellar biosynthesis/type III secretory pathway protein FliH
VKCVGLILILFALFFFTTAAAAQEVVIYGGSTDAREHGYQHGYRDGLRQGRADLVSNSSPNYESDDYRRADLGYEDFMGSRPDFQKGYRDGFKAGYEDGYKNRPVRSEIYGLPRLTTRTASRETMRALATTQTGAIPTWLSTPATAMG